MTGKHISVSLTEEEAEGFFALRKLLKRKRIRPGEYFSRVNEVVTKVLQQEEENNKKNINKDTKDE